MTSWVSQFDCVDAPSPLERGAVDGLSYRAVEVCAGQELLPGRDTEDGVGASAWLGEAVVDAHDGALAVRGAGGFDPHGGSNASRRGGA